MLSLITYDSIGNHEYGYDRGNISKDLSLVNDRVYQPVGEGFGHDSQGECAIPVYYRFGMPNKGLPPYYYSFNYGNAHFLMLSSEHNFSQGSPQYRWMEEDLRSVDRNLIPFVVVASHRPMYVSELWPSRFKVAEHQKNAYEDLVSLLLSFFSRLPFEFASYPISVNEIWSRSLPSRTLSFLRAYLCRLQGCLSTEWNHTYPCGNGRCIIQRFIL